jgi:Fe-S cluster assembly ATP-binding protein
MAKRARKTYERGKMLKITNLHAAVDGKEILKGFDIAVEPGEIHAVMAPNGSGKSTLPYILTGRDGYDVTAGEIRYLRRDLLDLAPEERAAG